MNISNDAVEAAADALNRLAAMGPGEELASAVLEAAYPHVQVNAVTILMDRGMPQRDAETALDAYRSTPPGEPYNSDAIRVDSILRAAL